MAFVDQTKNVYFDGKRFKPGTPITKADGSELSKQEMADLQAQGIGEQVVTQDEAEQAKTVLERARVFQQQFEETAARVSERKSKVAELEEKIDKARTESTKAQYQTELDTAKQELKQAEADFEQKRSVLVTLGLAVPQDESQA